MEKTKEDIVLDLVRDGKITNEQAKILLTTTKEYIYGGYLVTNAGSSHIGTIITSGTTSVTRACSDNSTLTYTC